MQYFQFDNMQFSSIHRKSYWKEKNGQIKGLLRHMWMIL